jgi:hypothetical protein
LDWVITVSTFAYANGKNTKERSDYIGRYSKYIHVIFSGGQHCRNSQEVKDVAEDGREQDIYDEKEVEVQEHCPSDVCPVKGRNHKITYMLWNLVIAVGLYMLIVLVFVATMKNPPKIDPLPRVRR